jgi:2-iminobutanoate/2-iminopropanoate deaminase
MPRDIIFTPKAAAPPPTYSQAVRAAGLVFVSGTAPADPVTGQLIEGGAAEQTAQYLRNIAAILESAGSSLEKAVSATIILADPDDFLAVNQEWLTWFPDNPPARQGSKMPVRVPGLKVSIAMIAEA